MDFNNEIEDQDIFVTEMVGDSSLSIEDFIKELEAKEKDLHISADLDIEFDESGIDDTNPSDFITNKIAKPHLETPQTNQNVTEFIPNNKTFSELEDEISQFKEQVSGLEIEREELAETIRRRQTDFDTYKRRIERDRRETFRDQLSNLVTQMLPVLDNMNRALDFAANHSEAKAADFNQFFEGIILVNQQLNDVLAAMGVSPISSVGEDFDPHIHEAVVMEVTEDFPPQTVTSELLRGYRIGDKIIRAAMVKVATAALPNLSNSSPDINLNAAEDISEAE